MTKYIEYFQIESKSLLKRFKQKDPATVALCKKYFESKDDISLMNAQHVIAKEHGFDSWNDLIKQEPYKLAKSLINEKNKIFTSTLSTISNSSNNLDTPRLNKPKLTYDTSNNKIISTGSFFFDYSDVSEYDLSSIDPLCVRYTKHTKWPEETSKLPKGFNPKELLETRKNPGLGIRTLHKMGIKGQGRNIAIIDPFYLFDHMEYHNALKGYEIIGPNIEEKGFIAIANGFLSSIVGKTCGIAPSAESYYYAVNAENRTQVYYAIAIKKAIELHKKLKSEGKSGLDVIQIKAALTSPLFKNDEGYEDTLKAVEEAEKLGIWVTCQYVFEENKKLRRERVFCKLDGDIENPNDYMLVQYSVLHKVPKTEKDLFINSLCFPTGARTVAQDMKQNEYVLDEYCFEHCNGPLSEAFAAGLYLLAKGVKENITPYEFFELGLKTGDFREGVGTIINPVRLIESLK